MMTKAERKILSEKIALEIREEMEHAEAVHGPFHSLHEALAVLREEYIETENAVFWEAERKNDLNLIRKEAIQVAAVATRLAVMLTPCPERCRPVADAEGITKSTLRDASCELGIRKIKETFSKRWMWSLPTDEATSEPAFSEFTDSGGEGRQGRGGAEPPDQRDRQETSGSTPQLCERLFAPSPDDLDAWRRILAEDPTLEPAIRGTADGMAPGLVADRLRIIGNGVVPMVVAYAFVLLAAAHVARNEASG